MMYKRGFSLLMAATMVLTIIPTSFVYATETMDISEQEVVKTQGAIENQGTAGEQETENVQESGAEQRMWDTQEFGAEQKTGDEQKSGAEQKNIAKLSGVDIDYDEESDLLQIDWDDTNVEYVTIRLNDSVLAEKCKKNSFKYNCKLQPGASYEVCIEPYNSKNEVGEEVAEKLVVGDFEIPDEPSVTVTSVAAANNTGNYTGFSKPAAMVEWDAQDQAIYEIYRAEKNTKSAYNWIATVQAQADDEYSYIDEKVKVGITYYYKIRRKIEEDDYVSQELLTALSDAGSLNISVPIPKLKTQLNDDGLIMLTMESSDEYVSGYDIYRKCGTGSYKKIASTTEDMYVDKTVEFGKTYYYKVKGYYYDVKTDKKSVSKNSKASKVKNTIGAISVATEAISADTVKISWTPVANAEGYEVYCKSGTQGDSYSLWMVTDKLSAKRKLKKSGTYAFMVKAYRTSESGKTYFSSAEVSCKMGFSAPTELKIGKTSRTFDKETKKLIQKDTLKWNRVYGASGYYIEVYNATTKKYSQVANIKKGSTVSYTISNAVTATSKPMKYRISAYSGGTVKKGETIEITPTLGEIKKVKVSKSGSKVKVSWKGVAGAETYKVYRSNGRTMLLVGETAKTSITDEGLSAGASYQYYVQAVNNTLKITGEKSLPVSYKTGLEKVSKLTAVNTAAGKVQLAWNAEKNAQTYAIYYKTGSGAKYQKIAEISSKKTSYVHEKQTVGTTCYYKVVAVQKNSGGIPIESEGVSVSVKIEK